MLVSKVIYTFALQFKYFFNYLLFFMKTGVVKFYNETKGYGFISIDESSEEVFVHSSGLIDKIKQDDKVQFEVVQGKKGVNAVEVRRI